MRLRIKHQLKYALYQFLASPQNIPAKAGIFMRETRMDIGIQGNDIIN